MRALLPLSVITTLLITTSGCDDAPPAKAPPNAPNLATSTTSPPPKDPSSPRNAPLKPDPHWVESHVDDAHQRLSESDAGKILLKSIEAHGGLSTFFNNGPLFFRFDDRPLAGAPRDTRQLIDTWSSRASHTLTDAPDVAFGYDGHNAWIAPANAKLPFNPRYWALTPYYFVALPFVLADPGVLLDYEGKASFLGQTYEVIRATFEPGVGDTPDDVYVLYLHPETYRLHAIRYSLSYPGLVPEGGNSPERLMSYDDPATFHGITLATSHKTYTYDDHQPGDLLTTITLSEIAFQPERTLADILPPKNASLLPGD
ncbi:hypothetical protein DL240_15650 [Lujinxingia litoralis]|uniref:Lipoprotein n=1 Tax=Lujinxingia litoralis TaxID=2211119 RepID=A0A328C2C0_9DELT|nr:DUF6503 family protein [Lujinxingia litoralis]RAL20750.1 hypothetical protein DL240_15650 [Lujinxingia litoralis]